MVFSKDDLAVIVACFTEKGWTDTRIAKEFPNEKWNYRSINRVLTKYRQTGSIDRKKGSGRPVTAMTDENNDFISSQEWTPHSPDFNPLDYSAWDILQELVYEGRREPFANLKDLQNVIRDKWHDVDDQTVRKTILQWKRRLAAVAKQNGGRIQLHFTLSFTLYS